MGPLYNKPQFLIAVKSDALTGPSWRYEGTAYKRQRWRGKDEANNNNDERQIKNDFGDKKVRRDKEKEAK